MAHWFHRNPMKATSIVKFDTPIAKGTEAKEICVALCTRRAKLLEVLSDPNAELLVMEETSRMYLSLLHGFIWAPGSSVPESKLRYALKFSWSNSMSALGVEHMVVTQQDALFEYLSMHYSVALWYSKRAARISGQESVSDNDAKDIFKALRISAGILTFVKESRERLLSQDFDKGSDLDDQVISAYLHQSLAEAQEVTMAHAVEQKHNPGLIAQLSSEASRMFQVAEHSLSSLEEKRFGKWKKYLEFKRECYVAYAFSFESQKKLAEDQAGMAIAYIRESGKHYDKAELLGKEYTRMSQGGLAEVPNSVARPNEHPFFKRLRPELLRVYDKLQRENDLIYHQKVPDTVPELELKAEYGLAKPETYTPFSPHELWTEKAVAAFDVSAALNKPTKDERVRIDPVKEKPYEKQAANDNNANSSGCVIS